MEKNNLEEYCSINPREHLSVHLDILQVQPDDSLKAWRGAVVETSNKIHHCLDSELQQIEQEQGRLSLAISLITVLALLVSKEFDTYLCALVEDDWSEIEPLYKQYASQWAIACPLTTATLERYPDLQDEFNAIGKCDFLTWEKWRQRHIRDHSSLFQCAYNRLEREKSRVPVKKFTPHENNSGRIALSIDPYCGIDTILESIKEYMQSWKVNLCHDIEVDWENELSQGVVDADFIQQEKIETSVSLGDKQAFKSNNKDRKPYTTLKMWQRSLRVFDLKRREYHWKIIVNQPWWTGNHDEKAQKYDIPDDVKRAKKLIAHALKGSPLIKSNIRIG